MAAGAKVAQQELIDSARPVGRPSIRTQAIEEEIFVRLSNGEGIERITQDAHMPGRATVSEWMKKDPEFLQAILTAYSFNTLFMAEMGMDVIDGGQHSTGNIERDKAKLSYIKWLMGKYNRPLFGEHIQITERQETVQINLPAEFGGFLSQNQQIEPKEPE